MKAPTVWRGGTAVVTTHYDREDIDRCIEQARDIMRECERACPCEPPKACCWLCVLGDSIGDALISLEEVGGDTLYPAMPVEAAFRLVQPYLHYWKGRCQHVHGEECGRCTRIKRAMEALGEFA